MLRTFDRCFGCSSEVTALLRTLDRRYGCSSDVTALLRTLGRYGDILDVMDGRVRLRHSYGRYSEVKVTSMKELRNFLISVIDQIFLYSQRFEKTWFIKNEESTVHRTYILYYIEILGMRQLT
ncbi:hypothetical protein V1477_016649 [Vespula maculifrons]|uniref:Uncharacterized protein n=1 Tax=Vespula maculifrons TaxID=7453 RepID=A0ABD2B8J8_VESMC